MQSSIGCSKASARSKASSSRSAEGSTISGMARKALAFEHPIYDCIYLALAVIRQLTLVTADRRMFDLAQRRPDPRRA